MKKKYWHFIMLSLVVANLAGCASSGEPQQGDGSNPSSSSSAPATYQAKRVPAGSEKADHIGISEANPVGKIISDLGDNAVIHFPYDEPKPGAGRSFTLNKANMDRIEEDAKFLKENPEQSVTIEGHCDPRGTQDYNLGLGERRAHFLQEQLIAQGVNKSQISIVSYGKQRPTCHEADETCWAKDRRAIITQAGSEKNVSGKNDQKKKGGWGSIF